MCWLGARLNTRLSILHDLADGFEARLRIDEWIGFYKTPKGHTRHSLGKPQPRPTAATRLWI